MDTFKLYKELVIIVIVTKSVYTIELVHRPKAINGRFYFHFLSFNFEGLVANFTLY